jgi:ribose transport system ATP-binding protein
MQARIIIMDEPTSAITEQEVAVLFDLIHQLKREGVAIVYITHKLDELPLIADEFTVMRDGHYVGSWPADGATHDEIVHMMVGRDLSEMYARSPAHPREEILRVEGLRLRHPERAGDFLVNDVSFYLRRGEVLGIFGLMGAGRTELLETLFGLHPKRASGSVTVKGEPVWFRSPREAIDAGIALAPEDRKHGGLVLSLGVAANISLACLPKMERFGFLNANREETLADNYVKRGGNQQKAVLAKWLATKPTVLLLDEPTRGIDINAKKEIYTLMDELADAGLGVVLVSSELPEILAVSDRILVMSEGRKTAEFQRANANEENLMKAALPKSRL